MIKLRKIPNQFSPSDFMRARRPELFTDTVFVEQPILDRSQLEFHLDTLTQRKEEIRFEHFCRRLAEKELCPNLLPQTGPTGGGDSKVDTETYPVAESIAERWYEGNPDRAARERWAFAFSAKKKWRPKIKDDVSKIANTQRGYSLIYFITNQAVRDQSRAAVEDELSRKYGVGVRILDRSWIVAKVMQNNRWDIVYQTLDIERPRMESKFMPGPLDAERLRDLEELDRLIGDATRYQGSEYQLTQDCLQTALLARGLGRPRTELDGRFNRAERLARARGYTRQLFRILYQRAWTAYWWFDDFAELDRLYKDAEPLVIDSQWIWDIEKLVNLWIVGNTWRQVEPSVNDAESWAIHTTRLREALMRHAADSVKPTSALWARTELVLMDLHDAAVHRERLPSLLMRINGIMEEAEGHPDYPVEPVVQIIQDLGRVLADEAYDNLIEKAIQLQTKRVGKAKQGQMRLELGFQKIEAGKTYDAIDQFAKAQILLAQEEHKNEFVNALVGTAFGYEAAGLLWAARANLLSAFDRRLYDFAKDGQITPTPKDLFILRKLIWVEIQLGRMPCILTWIEWLGHIGSALELDQATREKLDKEFRLMDAVVGILILKTRFGDWPSLDRVPALLERFSLLMSRMAALFSLGYEQALRSEYGQADTDLEEFFSKWLNQPAASDLPAETEWHLGSTVAMRTAIMGCEIELLAENHATSVLLGEAILAFLESFLSTTIRLKSHYAVRPFLRMEIRQSEYGRMPFNYQVAEDECGETKIIIIYPQLSLIRIVQDENFQDALFRLLGEFIQQLQLTFSRESLEGLFSKERAHDRAILVAQSPVHLTNILGENPKYEIKSWIDESLTESLALSRTVPWKGRIEPVLMRDGINDTPFAFADGPPPPGLFGIDGLKHRDLRVLSPINMALWDKARWQGMGFAILPGNPPMPELVLLFEDLAAGQKIFRGWQKRLGASDQDEWIGLTIITGIDRKHPPHYRVTVSINEEYLGRINKPKGQFAMVFRMQDMMPGDSTNLDRFVQAFEKAGCYRLCPGLFAPTRITPFSMGEYGLHIEKRQLRVLPAWQVGPNDPAIIAIRRTDDPIIPADVSAPPILETLKKIRELREQK